MSHTAVRRVALTSFAVNVFCLMAVILAASMIRPPRLPVSPAPDTPVNIPEERTSFALPMKIECTSLTVQTMAIYDGPFYEDGSGQEVRDVAAVLVSNDSDALIPYANIVVDTENDRFVFHAHMLPPQSVTLVPESSAKPYTPEKIVNLYAWHTVKQDQTAPQVGITEKDDVTLQIENSSGKTLQDLTLYFKKYIDGVYIGGKPFEFTVPTLEKNACIAVSPTYYVRGYSQVLFYEEETISPPYQQN